MAVYKGIPHYNSPSSWVELNKQLNQERPIQFKGGNVTNIFEKWTNKSQKTGLFNIE